MGGENQCMGVTVLIGEQVKEHDLQGLIKAMNGGADQFRDEARNTHKLCVNGGPQDITRCFDAVSQWTNKALLGARAKWRFSCEKIEKLQQLVKLREEQMHERTVNTIKQAKSKVKDIDDSEHDSKRRMEENSQEL